MDIPANLDFYSREDKSCADNYVTVFTIENSERTHTGFCDTEVENDELSFDFELGSIGKGQAINACAFNGDILEGEGDEF